MFRARHVAKGAQNGSWKPDLLQWCAVGDQGLFVGRLRRRWPLLFEGVERQTQDEDGAAGSTHWQSEEGS